MTTETIIDRPTDNFHSAVHEGAQKQYNPENKRIVFFVGSNIAAHCALRDVIDRLVGHGIPSEVYLTDIRASYPDLKDKISRPEIRHYAAYEKGILFDVIYPLLDENEIALTPDGNLIEGRMYAPWQLADHFKEEGVTVAKDFLADPSKPETLPLDINNPEFVNYIRYQKDIILGCGIRSMPIIKTPLLNAFEYKEYRGLYGHLFNAHPGNLMKDGTLKQTFPGTYISFWTGMEDFPTNHWTLHIMDEKVDTGPILDTASDRTFPTMMENTCGMRIQASEMISGHIIKWLSWAPEDLKPPRPQDQEDREKERYTYPTHEQWQEFHQKGGLTVNPRAHIKWLVDMYAGGQNTPLGKEMFRQCMAYIAEKQAEYIEAYKSTYGTTVLPPEFGQDDFYIDPSESQGLFRRMTSRVRHGTPGSFNLSF